MGNLTLTIAGTSRNANLDGDSVRFTESIGQRNTFECSVFSLTGAWKPSRGQPVLLNHATAGDLFGGYIASASWNKASGSDAIFSDLNCASYEHEVYRRRCAAATYIDQTLETIFESVVNDSLTGDGFTVTAPTGPTIPLFEIGEPRPSVGEVLDKLMEVASSASASYFWDSTPSKQIRCYTNLTYPAPFNITDANVNGLQVDCKVTDTNEGMSNRVFVYLGQTLTDPKTDTLAGNGTRNYRFAPDGGPVPMGSQPIITVDSVAQTVGIRGVDSGKQWYWSQGSDYLDHDSGEPLLTGANSISVTAQVIDARTFGPISDAAAITAEATLQGGGTGYYEAYLTFDDISTTVDAETAADAFLAAHAASTVTFEGSTFTPGLRAGQYLTVNLAKLGINRTMLIESVTMTVTGPLIRWSFRASSGQVLPTWEQKLLGGDATARVTGAASPTPTTVDEVPPTAPTSIIGREKSGSRYWDVDHLTKAIIEVEIDVPANTNADAFIVERSINGTDWGAGTRITNSGGAGASTITADLMYREIIPALDVTTYKVRAYPSNALYAGDPSTATVSAAFTITGLGTPIDSAIPSTALTIASGGVGNFPYNVVEPDGRQYWKIGDISYDDSGVLADPTIFFIRVTVQDLDASHTAVGPEHVFQGRERVGGVYSCGPLAGAYGTDGYSYTRTGNIAYVRVKVYAINRKDETTDSFLNSGAATLQAGIGGSLGYVDVLVAADGKIPEGAVPADRLKRASIGGGLVVDAITGELRVPTAAAPINRVTNATFATGIAGWVPYASGSGSWSHDAVEGKSAAGSLKSSVLVGDGNLYDGQVSACAPGEVITLSAWYKTSSGAAGNAYLIIQFRDSGGIDIGGGYYQHTGPWGASTSWAAMSYTFPAAPAGAAYAQIYVGVDGSATGSWWFDDVSFTVPAGFGLGTDPTGNLIFLPGNGLGDDGAGSVAVKLNDAAEMEFVDGKVSIKGVNFTKGFNGFDVGSAAIPKITVSPDGVPVGWIGKDTTSGYAGAWFKRCYIGGTSPSNAGIVADATGNVSISGSLIVGAVASATSAGSATTAVSALSAGTLSLNLNNITTVVNNSLNNGYVTSFYSILATGAQPRIWITPEQIVFGNSSFATLANVSITSGRGFIQVANTTGGQVYLDGAGNVGATGVVAAIYGFVAGGNGGLSTTISYVKPGGATGTMTFTGGILTGST